MCVFSMIEHMANINELLNKLPYDQIAAKTGQDPETIRSASEGV